MEITGLENREYGRREPSRWPRGTIYPQKLALSSPTSGGRSVGIVRSRTQAMELSKWKYICKYMYKIQSHCKEMPENPSKNGLDSDILCQNC
jgi:hypothetical protein